MSKVSQITKCINYLIKKIAVNISKLAQQPVIDFFFNNSMSYVYSLYVWVCKKKKINKYKSGGK